jgi:hypothetical protein
LKSLLDKGVVEVGKGVMSAIYPQGGFPADLEADGSIIWKVS